MGWTKRGARSTRCEWGHRAGGAACRAAAGVLGRRMGCRRQLQGHPGGAACPSLQVCQKPDQRGDAPRRRPGGRRGLQVRLALALCWLALQAHPLGPPQLRSHGLPCPLACACVPPATCRACAGDAVFLNDSRTLLFTTQTEDTHRPDRVWWLDVGRSGARQPRLLYHEPDERFHLGLWRSRSGACAACGCMAA